MICLINLTILFAGPYYVDGFTDEENGHDAKVWEYYGCVSVIVMLILNHYDVSTFSGLPWMSQL